MVPSGRALKTPATPTAAATAPSLVGRAARTWQVPVPIMIGAVLAIDTAAWAPQPPPKTQQTSVSIRVTIMCV